jgi:hypothetical protein
MTFSIPILSGVVASHGTNRGRRPLRVYVSWLHYFRRMKHSFYGVIDHTLWNQRIWKALSCWGGGRLKEKGQNYGVVVQLLSGSMTKPCCFFDFIKLYAWEVIALPSVLHVHSRHHMGVSCAGSGVVLYIVPFYLSITLEGAFDYVNLVLPLN